LVKKSINPRTQMIPTLDKILEKLQQRTKFKFPRKGTICKNNGILWILIIIFFVDYHKRTMNHTCDWDLLFEDKKMFHLPCQFNKKVIWINWSISRESLFLCMARTSMLKATKFIDQHLHNKHMMKMMSFNCTTMLMNLNI